MTNSLRTSRAGIKYMTRSEANAIFKEFLDAEKLKELLGDNYDRKKSIILLKIRNKAYAYDSKKTGNAELEKYLKKWIRRFY